MLLEEFSLHIAARFSIIKGKKILVAVSGGLDSMVLSHLLYALDYNPILAHCNFQLREEESDDDAKFVSKFANRLGLVHHEKSFDTNSYASKQKCAIQEAARELRYHWFNELLSNHNYDFLMTAHHSDDNLETFFINFLRGTGLDGLTGIPEVNGTTIRPLLPFSKSDLASYAKQNGISWREDCSNKSDKYVRNKLRNEIIPILKEMNTGILHTFNQTIDHLKESRAIIDEHMIQLKEQIVHTENGETKISIKGLSLMKDPSIYLYELLKEYGFNAWKDIKNLLNAQSGKVILSHSHQLLKDRAYLVLTSLKDTGKMSHVMPELGEYEFDDLQITVSNGKPDFSGKEKGIAFVDKDEIEFPLYLRKWKNGDYFYPLGMQGKKKLSDYFIDNKRSKNEKEATWILCDKNKIIWIVNDRLDHRVRITDQSKSALIINFNSAK